MDEQQPTAAGAPSWMVTFGDLMALLLTCFIMLASMSELKHEEKYRAMLQSMRRQFGQEASLVSFVTGRQQALDPAMQPLASLGRARRDDLIHDQPSAAATTSRPLPALRSAEGSVAAGMVRFAPHSADLDDTASAQLQQIATQVAGARQTVEVRGHADPSAMSGDSWDLAHRRARVIREQLVTLGIAPERVRLGAAAAISSTADQVEVLLWDPDQLDLP